ncbi:MAG TPA: hypothetical protein DIC18_04615 [Clostridiales bacterium]|nr:hypothetical protein [Clostridiales bacterium]
MSIGLERPQKNNVIIDTRNMMPDKGNILHEDRILSDLKDISDKYAADLNKRANDYADKVVSGEFVSDEELLGQAKQSLDSIYGEKTKKLRSSTEEKTEALDLQKNEAAGDYANRQSALRERYEKAWDNNLESLSKKGMSHSSTAALTKDLLQSDYAADAAENERKYTEKVDGLERKIQKYNAAYEDALRNYEITYAIELEDKVAKLKKQRDQMVESYNKSHQSERQAAFDQYKDEELSRNKKYEEETGDYSGGKKQNYQERYEYLLSALDGKNKGRIDRFLEKYKNELKEYLGLYYDSFLEEVR